MYIGKITLSTPSNTCDGIYMENAYVLRYGCNTCSSKDVQERLKQDTIACTKQCKTTMNACVYDGIFNDWGGYYNVDQHPSCSPLKNTSLSGCAESSSSQIMESSSSEEQSSSSNENSNSLEESSSSEDLDFSSSSEGDCGEDDPYGCSSASEESSSSEVLCPCTDEDGPCFDDDGICSESGSSSSGESMSSSANANVIACYEPDENGGCKFSHYVSKERPPMHGEPSLSESDIIFCEYTDNQIYVGYFAHIGNPWLIDERLVDLRSCYYDENNCGNLPPRNAPPIPMLPPPFYECYLSPMDENGCEKTQYGLGVFVDKNLQIAERTASWIPSNVTRDQIIAMGDEIVRRERSMIVHYNGNKIGTGFIDNLNPRNLASAVWFCDYIINQYEREHRSSSSTQVQSSCSSAESSSSATELSSSSGKLLSSSSDETPESSSSFIEESSSSSVGAETFVSDGNQTYTPDQIFKEGLQNMEDGLCYSLNPERGTVNGWNISYNAQDSWWWREVDCETGDKVDRNRIGACPGFPLDNVPSKPERACIAYNGKCYRCNPSNSFVDCSADWLWKYSFDLGLVSRGFYKQVDCDDPFEKHDNQCPDGNVLMKRVADYGDAENASVSGYDIDFINNVKYYDVLGRKTSRANSGKQVLYRKSNDNFYKKSADQLQQTIENIFERINQGYNKRGLFKRRDCGHLGGDYGIIENGQKVGGITCLVAEPNFSTPSVLDNKFLEETCVINGCKYKKVWVKVGTTLQMTLISIKDYVVETGFVFPNGYVTTTEDREAVKKHEKGHVKDFECIANKFSEDTRYVEVEVEACNEKDALNAAITESVQPYLDEMKKEYDKRFKRATDRYHQKYDSFKYPEDNYVCPSDL